VVVDSASSDGSADDLPRGLLPLRVVRHRENVGFCAGNNLGAEAARGRLIVFTQPDGEVQEAWDVPLRAALADPQVAAAGGVVVQMETGLILQAGMVIGPNLSSWGIDEGLTPAAAGLDGDGPPRSVACVSPEFLAVRRADHLRIGGFWEELWMYGDEPDYALRMATLGGAVICPAARMRHWVGASSGPYQSTTRLYWSSRNRLLNSARHLPPSRLLLAVALSLGMDLLQVLQRSDRAAAGAIAGGWRDGLRGMRPARRLSTPDERRADARRLAPVAAALRQQRALGRMSVRRPTGFHPSE
jgi:GT2 family glycosyltransferase